MICCICSKEFDEFEKVELAGQEWIAYSGHNPSPVKEEGRCCSDCNYEVVIPERMKRIYNQQKK
jgi:hypothetical protein